MPIDVVAIVAILSGAFVLIVAIGCVTGIVTERNKGGRALHDDEQRLMQELHHGFTKMERRVESLETLLLERETKGRVPL